MALLGPCFKTGAAVGLSPPAALPRPVSLFLSNPGQHLSLTVLVRYRSRSHTFPWVESTTPSLCTTNHSYSSASPLLPGPRAFTGLRVFSDACPSIAAATTPFGFSTGPNLFVRHYYGRRVCFRFLPLLICLSLGGRPPTRATSVHMRTLLTEGYAIRPPGFAACCTRLSRPAAAFFVLRANGSTERI